MFGINDDDDFGGKKSVSSNSQTTQQYGRNQQYGRQAATNNAQNNKGGVLKFEDSDSDDNDGNQLILGQNSIAKSQVKSNSSTFQPSDRPTTGNSKSGMELQRENLLKSGFRGAETTKMTFNNKPGSGYSYGQNTDIDFNKLKTIVNENSSGMYEPGALGSKGTGLAPLSKTNNMVKFDENDDKQNQKLINLEDSDEEDDIISNVKQNKQQTELFSEQKQSPTAQLPPPSNPSQTPNARQQADALLKNLYGDSSDESEEDDKKAHEKMLEQEKKGALIPADDDEDEEDQKGAVQTQALASEVVQQINNPDKAPDSSLTPAAGNPLVYHIAENIEIFDMKQFLTKPIPKGMIIQMTIRRDKSGFARFYPKYHLHLSSSLRYLMTGKKRSSNKTSNYLMSMSKTELTKKSANFLGKVRSNFLGTEFHVFDTGENPKKCKNPENARKELSGVIYESNLLGSRGPRKMKVIIPQIMANGDPVVIRPRNNKEGIFQMLKAGQMENLLYFGNKPPKWNDGVQAFVLNFNGRVDRPSVKNFQLVDESNDELVLLQFGRIGDDAFNMDASYPFSIVQAFGICLSSFDYKIACE